jgi:hypothetical protein
MREKICYLVHTEYHLLLSITDIMERYNDDDKYDIYIVIKRKKNSKRLNQELDIDFLPYHFIFLEVDINLASKLNPEEKQDIDELGKIDFSTFIFFQEQDPVTVVLIDKLAAKGTKIYLFQDGLKAYIFDTMKFSLGLIQDNIKANKWIKRNGYAVSDPFSFLRCRKYAFLKNIDKVFLTFPEAYNNRNNKSVGLLSTAFTEELRNVLKRVFKWQDDLLPVRENVIFFMNQPMGDDGSFEINLLKNLRKRYPNNVLYIKLHPLTSDAILQRYKELDNISVINSKVPAELFISELKNSIVMSVYSSSMFINNESCKFLLAA